MIVIPMGETALVDYEVLLIECKRPLATIRKHCRPATVHIGTGTLLFDVELAKNTLAKVKRRARKPAS